MGYTVAQVEEIAERLRALPTIEPRPKDLTKSDVVKMLAKEIKSLQKRGYSLEQIANSLKGVGLDISTPTLKSYMNKAKAPTKPKLTEKGNSKTLPTLPEGKPSSVRQVKVAEDNKIKDSSGSIPRPDSDDL